MVGIRVDEEIREVLETKDSSLYRRLIDNLSDESYVVDKRSFLFKEVEKVFSHLVDFYCLRTDILNVPGDRYYRRVLGYALYNINPVEEIKVSEANEKVVECIDRALGSGFADFIFDVLKAGEDEKLNFLLSRKSKKDSSVGWSDIEMFGTHVSDANFICAQACSKRFYIVSSLSTVSAFYFPDLCLVVTSDSNIYTIAPRIKKLLVSMCVDAAHYTETFCSGVVDSRPVFCIRTRRPFHALFDQYSGYFYLKNTVDSDIKIVSETSASFFKFIPLLGDPKQKAYKDILITAHVRLKKGLPWYNDLIGSLRVSAFVKEKRYRVYISILGDEKRKWIEEEETLVGVIKFFDKRFDSDVDFILDGYTGKLVNSAQDEELIQRQRASYDAIVRVAGLSEDRFVNVVGSGLDEKVGYSLTSDFAFVPVGTPMISPVMLAEIPAYVHGCEEMLKKEVVLHAYSKVYLPDYSDICSLDSGGKAWHAISYSLKSESVLRKLNELF